MKEMILPDKVRTMLTKEIIEISLEMMLPDKVRMMLTQEIIEISLEMMLLA